MDNDRSLELVDNVSVKMEVMKDWGQNHIPQELRGAFLEHVGGVMMEVGLLKRHLMDKAKSGGIRSFRMTR